MIEIVNTRLRYICSKDPEKVVLYPNSLGYKIEIKGNPIFCSKDKKWYLWFIIPDVIDSKIEIASGDLD